MDNLTDSKNGQEYIAILHKAGLTDSQARGYMALVESGALTPVDLADKTGESRTNGYMICEKLEKLGLATKKESTDQRKKLLYAPTHPSALEALAEKRRKVVIRNEQEVKQGILPLIDLFYVSNELPGTRTLQGIDGIKEVYDDTLRAHKDIYLIRSSADVADLGRDYLDNYRRKRAQSGINTYALTPMTELALQHLKSGEDEAMLFHRTFLPEGFYTAPVEIDIYGNKVALIAFGETQMATIVDSHPIAEAFRQLCKLIIHSYADHSRQTVDELSKK